jgi:hypothetical protein
MSSLTTHHSGVLSSVNVECTPTQELLQTVVINELAMTTQEGFYPVVAGLIPA